MERLSLIFLFLAIFAYTLATLAYLEHFLAKGRRMGAIATALCGFGLASQIISFIFRMSASGHLIGTSAYESLALASFFVVLGGLIIELRSKTRTLSLFMLPVALLFLLRAYTYYKPPTARYASLSGSLIDIHFISMFVASAAFAVAAVAALLYLLEERGFKKKQASLLAMRLPALSSLEDLQRDSILLGFIFLSATLITGAIRAKELWGTFFDAIVITAALAWAIYLGYLLFKRAGGLRGRKGAIVAILGFGVILAIRFIVVPYLSFFHGYRA